MPTNKIVRTTVKTFSKNVQPKISTQVNHAKDFEELHEKLLDEAIIEAFARNNHAEAIYVKSIAKKPNIFQRIVNKLRK